MHLERQELGRNRKAETGRRGRFRKNWCGGSKGTDRKARKYSEELVRRSDGTDRTKNNCADMQKNLGGGHVAGKSGTGRLEQEGGAEQEAMKTT